MDNSSSFFDDNSNGSTVTVTSSVPKDFPIHTNFLFTIEEAIKVLTPQYLQFTKELDSLKHIIISEHTDGKGISFFYYSLNRFLAETFHSPSGTVIEYKNNNDQPRLYVVAVKYDMQESYDYVNGEYPRLNIRRGEGFLMEYNIIYPHNYGSINSTIKREPVEIVSEGVRNYYEQILNSPTDPNVAVIPEHVLIRSLPTGEERDIVKNILFVMRNESYGTGMVILFVPLGEKNIYSFITFLLENSFHSYFFPHLVQLGIVRNSMGEEEGRFFCLSSRPLN